MEIGDLPHQRKPQSRAACRRSLIFSSVLVICANRSVCSRKSVRNSAVSGRTSGCSAEKSSSCACISASGVRSSWAALPVNCRWAAKALFSRYSIWLNERLSCRNSEIASSSIHILARLFSCACSTCEAKLRRGLRARPLTK